LNGLDESIVAIGLLVADIGRRGVLFESILFLIEAVVVEDGVGGSEFVG